MASCRSSRLVTEAATREEVAATREAVRDRELVADTTKVYDTVRVTIMQRPGELPDTMQSRSIRVERVRDRERERDSVSEERHEVSSKQEVRETEVLTAPLFSRREKTMVVAIVIEALMLCVTLASNRRKNKR